MAKHNTTRDKLRRIAKEQWIPDLVKMQQQLGFYAADYIEGSEHNQRQSAEMVIISQIAEELKKAINILLDEL